MANDWYPFFSMFYWLVTKLAGLGLLLTGVTATVANLAAGFHFWTFVLGVLPLVLGWFILATEFLFDLGVAEMGRRQKIARG